jgi:hypothetical protein
MRVADGGLSGRPIHCEAAEVYRSVISMAQGLTLRVDQVLDVCWPPELREILLWL